MNTNAPVVVLTGASSGIGRATAHELARRGARLVLAARGEEALKRVADECREHGADVLTLPTDVTDAQAVRTLGTTAISRYGRIDVWINNVGVGAVGRYDLVPLDAHTRVIASNLLGHMHGAHVALMHFRERRRGTLINMISIGGWLSAPYAAAYTASKFALRGLGESLRAEMSDLPNVHVCDVAPSFVDTPGVSHGANYTRRSLKPLPPLLDPAQVARRIADLAERPRAVLPIGAPTWIARYAGDFAVETRGRAVRRFMDFALSRAQPSPPTEGNLFDPSATHDIRGGYRRGGRMAPIALAAGATLAVAALGWFAARRLTRAS